MGSKQILAAIALGAAVLSAPSAAGAGSCTVTGTNGDDILHGTEQADVICGLGGNDTIYAYDGADVVYGGPGDDTIYGGNGADALWGKQGNDTIHGGNGNDRIGGAEGNDQLFGDDGNDTIYGAGGDDTIMGGLGADRLWGHGGEDIIWGRASDGGTQDYSTDTGRNVLGGGADYDILHAGSMGDTLYFGTGAGEAYGNVGNDRILGPTWTPPGEDAENAVYIIAGGGADFVVMGAAGPGTNRKSLLDDVYYPGSYGTWNVVDGNSRTRGILGGPSVGDVVYGGAYNDYIEGAELVWGRAGDDSLSSSDGAARFFGEEGNDGLSGSNQDDELVGGPGNDYIVGRKGADILRGGPGADRISGGSSSQVSDGGNTIWAGTDTDIDTIYAVESDQCGASPEDTINGTCTR